MVQRIIQPPPLVPVTRRSRVLERRLRSHITQSYGPGDRLPAIEKLARDMGVGITNMRRAAKALTQRGMLIARPGSGTFVAPSLVAAPGDDPAADSLEDRPLAGKIVHLLVSGFGTDGMIRDMIRAAALVIADAGATVVQDRWEMGDSQDLINRTVADAVMLFNPQAYQMPACRPDQWVTIVSTAIVPTPVKCRGYDVVSINHEQGAELAGAHARKLGHRRALFVGAYHHRDSSRLDQTSSVRLAAFERGLGASISPQHVFRVESYSHIHGVRSAANYAEMTSPPELIFAASDELAIGFIYGMTAHRRIAGRDYHIIGFDALKAARSSAVAGLTITSVETPAVAMGKTAGQLLVERARDPELPARFVNLACGLFLGDSIRPRK